MASGLLAGCVATPERTSGRVVVHDENTRAEVAVNSGDRDSRYDDRRYSEHERERHDDDHRYREHERERHAHPQFSDADRKYIDRYYKKSKGNGNSKKNGKGLPPGLAKREQLPPGLQKQIVRNGKLPPGLEGHPLPHELERELAPLPKGYMRMQVGTDLVILDSNTRVTVDVIKDLLL